MDIIDIAHYDTEKITMDFFVNFFAAKAPDLEVRKSKANKRIYKLIIDKEYAKNIKQIIKINMLINFFILHLLYTNLILFI